MTFASALAILDLCKCLKRRTPKVMAQAPDRHNQCLLPISRSTASSRKWINAGSRTGACEACVPTALDFFLGKIMSLTTLRSRESRAHSWPTKSVIADRGLGLGYWPQSLPNDACPDRPPAGPGETRRRAHPAKLPVHLKWSLPPIFCRRPPRCAGCCS